MATKHQASEVIKESNDLDIQQKLFESVVSKGTQLESALEASRAEARELRAELERSRAAAAAVAAEAEELRHELAYAKSSVGAKVPAPATGIKKPINRATGAVMVEPLPIRISGWLEKLDKGAMAWIDGNKRKFAVLSRSHLMWYDKEPEEGGVLHGNIDLRRVNTLRSSLCYGAPESAVDIIVKESDRTYTFAPRVYPWLYLFSSAVPQVAVAPSLAAYRDEQLVVNLMCESGSEDGKEAPGPLAKGLTKLGHQAQDAPSSLCKALIKLGTGSITGDLERLRSLVSSDRRGGADDLKSEVNMSTRSSTAGEMAGVGAAAARSVHPEHEEMENVPL